MMRAGAEWRGTEQAAFLARLGSIGIELGGAVVCIARNVKPPVTLSDSSNSAETPPAGVEVFEQEVVAVFADLVALLGLPKSMGEIYGLLFAASEPLSFADIERKLGLSKGSVSQGLRALRDLGAIREADTEDGPAAPETGGEAGRGARATRWVAVIELRKLVGALLRDRLTPYLQDQEGHVERAARGLAELPPEWAPQRARMLRARLDKLQTWQSRGRTILPLVGKLL